MRNIVKYLGISLVIVGILLVMKNLFTKDGNFELDNKFNNAKYYTANIKLLDRDSRDYVVGARLVLKNSKNNVVAEWTTEKKSHKVSELENGKYTLIQTNASDNYHLNKLEINFEIKNENKNIIMYNVKMTEDEIKEANTSKSEVGVDNTLSTKNILTSIIAIIIIFVGLNKIYILKKEY